MKNIFNYLFSVFKIINTKKTSEQQLDNKNTKLIFNFYFVDDKFFNIQYDIVQIKRKDNLLKCIAKLSDKSKKILQDNKINIDFINDCIIFPLNNINVNKLLFFDQNVQTYSTLKANAIKRFQLPAGSFIVTMDENADQMGLTQYLRQSAINFFNSYDRKFFNK